MDTKLIVSASPHVRSDETTQSLMANVIVALCPCVVASAIIFGVRALLVTAVSVVACVAFEWLYCKLLKRANPISDLSAVVTGIILAMNVPVGMPIGQLIIGDLVAIIVVKQLFGGIGMNFANPALVGRIVLFISFAGSMNKWVFPDAAVDQLSKATPLAVADPSKLSLLDLFMGIHGGVLGETCALAIVLGLIYLVATKTISIAIPASYIGSMFIFYLISTGSLHGALVGILSGGLMFGAVFMATDYVTSPFTLKGKIVYGVFIGIVKRKEIISYFFVSKPRHKRSTSFDNSFFVIGVLIDPLNFSTINVFNDFILFVIYLMLLSTQIRRCSFVQLL